MYDECPDCDGNDEKCFLCNGTGLICEHCGEAEDVCDCDENEGNTEDEGTEESE